MTAVVLLLWLGLSALAALLVGAVLRFCARGDAQLADCPHVPASERRSS